MNSLWEGGIPSVFFSDRRMTVANGQADRSQSTGHQLRQGHRASKFCWGKPIAVTAHASRLWRGYWKAPINRPRVNLRRESCPLAFWMRPGSAGSCLGGARKQPFTISTITSSHVLAEALCVPSRKEVAPVSLVCSCRSKSSGWNTLRRCWDRHRHEGALLDPPFLSRLGENRCRTLLRAGRALVGTR